MKMKLFCVALCVAFVLGIGIDTLVEVLTVEAAAVSAEDLNEYIEMEATAYCLDGTTATGTHTRPGICAGKREWFGKTAVVYADDHGEIGDLIGIYKVEDTGGAPKIKNGQCLDIWMSSYDAAIQFGRRKVHVYLMDEE